MAAPLTWVVGSGGLLGSAVVRELTRAQAPHVVSRVPWSQPAEARSALARQAAAVVETGQPWRLVWCAGAGVTGTAESDLQDEIAALKTALNGLGSAADAGQVVLASSAGGVYAGSQGAPHTEFTAPRPISAYGENKLRAETALNEWAIETGGRGVVARYSNLYGPGQNLSKPQGLVSHLCRGYLLAKPISIYVPVDTLRDYLYVDDAAKMTTALLATDVAPGTTLLKICAAGRAVTVGGLLGACRAVFHRAPRVTMGSSELASMQALDLRLRSVVLPVIDAYATTPLVAGIASTLDAMRTSLFGPESQSA